MFFTLGRTIGLLIFVFVVLILGFLLTRLDARLGPVRDEPENVIDPPFEKSEESSESRSDRPARQAKTRRRRKHGR